MQHDLLLLDDAYHAWIDRSVELAMCLQVLCREVLDKQLTDFAESSDRLRDGVTADAVMTEDPWCKNHLLLMGANRARTHPHPEHVGLPPAFPMLLHAHLGMQISGSS